MSTSTDVSAEPFDFELLDPNSLKMERLVHLGLSFVLIVLGALGVLFFCLTGDPSVAAMVIVGGGWLVGAVLLVSVGWWFPRLAYDRAVWRRDAGGFEIRRGVWWRHRIIVPRTRIQHSDIEQGPLERYFGLSRLILHTAGTKNASVELAGLRSEIAEALRDALIRDESFGTGS